MRILLATSEIHPYSKTGGLADMVGALAKFVAKSGQEVGVVTPLYAGIQERFPDIHPLNWRFDLPLGPRHVSAEILALKVSEQLTLYFVHQPDFFLRTSLYQDNGVDYTDNAARFIFFSKCVVQLARHLPLKPELVHLHDWQAGLVPVLILHQKSQAGWGEAPRTCLTIHNLAYQGQFARSCYELTNLPWDYFQPDGVEFYGGLNCLKAGIIYSDVITTVSPRYAREITTEAMGCGLDGVLRNRQNSLVGILNGVDYSEWKTVGNPFLANSYTVRNLNGKATDKARLQQELSLPVQSDIPLFGNISRLVDQKGSDIQLGALEEMLASDMQFVLLGTGSPGLEKAYLALARRFPTKVAIRISYDQALSHRIEAACDFYLMPSKFEPCGLNQMYSLRYGTIPIVRAIGGLDDSVIDPSEDAFNANGIKFFEHSPRTLAKAMRKALALYRDQTSLDHFRKNAMRANFSWEKTAQEYLEVYSRVLGL